MANTKSASRFALLRGLAGFFKTALCAGAVFCASSALAGYISTQKAVVPGAWTSDFDGAKAYSEENGVPMIVFWANVGCSHCEGIEKEMNKAAFLEWMDREDVLMVFVESNSKVKKWIKSYAKGSISAYPFMAVYWPEMGVYEGFSAYKGNMSMYGASSKDSNIDQIIYTLDYLLSGWNPSAEPAPVPDPVYYTVTFTVDGNKGTVVSGDLSQSVQSGKGATAPKVSAKEGWEFAGWDKSFDKVTSDLAVTAKFAQSTPVPDPVYYTVTFVVDPDKGTVVSGDLSQRVEKGKGASAPSVAANEGWEFVGWDKSFSKVAGDITVSAVFEIPVDRPEINPAVFFKKAKTLEAVAYKEDELFGKAAITLGKYNAKKGYLKATFKITSFGGKAYSKSLNVVPNEFGDFLDVDVAFKSPIGTMTFNIVNGEDGYEVVGEGDEYYVEVGDVVLGGTLENADMAFGVEFDDSIEPENDSFDFIIDAPTGAFAEVKGGKTVNFGSAPKITYKKFKEDGETWYELAEYDDDERYPNANAIKLTYKPATGVFSGSFKMYASNELSVDEGKKPTLKTYTAKFSGYVVNGVGIGTVSVKIGKKTYTGTCLFE